MKRCLIPFCALLALALGLPLRAGASCDQAICLMSAEALALDHLITFDDMQSPPGIDAKIDGLVVLKGARFGEHFAGQVVSENGVFDTVSGAALSPLTAVPGPPGRSLGVIRFPGNKLLVGQGPKGFPHLSAVGEGAIAIEFDNDQAALAFDLRGGEQGEMVVIFLRRDGVEIARLRVGPLAEERYGFARGGGADPDIAGVLILNTDPEGISIDNLAFDRSQLTG